MMSTLALALSKDEHLELEVVATPSLSAPEDLWSKLPGELLARVSFLSVPTLFRCYAVCKKWNNLISSPAFSDVCAQAPIQKSNIILLGFPGLSSLWLAYMFDTQMNKWYLPIDLRFLQPCWDSSTITHRRVLASSGPVLCISAILNEDTEILVVCNPITRTYNKLPLIGVSPPFGSVGLVNLTFDQSPEKAYKIFYVEFLFIPCNMMYPPDDRFSHLYMFDSNVACWQTLTRIPKGLYHEQSVDRCSMVQFRNVTYILWYEDSPSSPYLGDGSHVLMAYDHHNKVWNKVANAISTLSLRRARLVVSGAMRLLLIGALEDSYHIWELEVASHECIEIAHMPDFYFRRMLDDPFNALICGVNEDVFLMSAKGKPVLFDITTRSWQRLPALGGNSLHNTLPQFTRCNLFEHFVNFCIDTPISY